MADDVRERPRRKTMFLGPEALKHLAATSSRRRTEREAVEEALTLLAERDAQRDAMRDFVDWAVAEWGEPTSQEKAAVDAIWHHR